LQVVHPRSVRDTTRWTYFS